MAVTEQQWEEESVKISKKERTEGEKEGKGLETFLAALGFFFSCREEEIFKRNRGNAARQRRACKMCAAACDFLLSSDRRRATSNRCALFLCVIVGAAEHRCVLHINLVL